MVTGFSFLVQKAKTGKHLLHFCVCCGANSWYLSELRERRRRKDAVFSCQRSVVKDRERHCLLIALIVRRRGVIICKHRQRGRLQCSPIKAKARDDFAAAYVRAEVRTMQRFKCDCPGCQLGLPCSTLYPSSASRSLAITVKSSSVVMYQEISPCVASSLSMRRMILPLRVLGRNSVKRMSSGRAREPISFESHTNRPWGKRGRKNRSRQPKEGNWRVLARRSSSARTRTRAVLR